MELQMKKPLMSRMVTAMKIMEMLLKQMSMEKTMAKGVQKIIESQEMKKLKTI
jgi:hypothetical protein